MRVDIDLYWSFRSPFCYLAAPGAQQLEIDFDVRVQLRPVLPLALRDASFFSPANVRRAAYIRLDAPRRARVLGMPFAWPQPDPVRQDLSTWQIADEQPHIHRLTRLGAEAQRRGRGLAFAREASALIFGGTRDWHEGAHLATAAARAGLDLDAMDDAIASPAHADAAIDTNQLALAAAGHWGVPTLVLDGEPYFGEDRIDTLRWRLDALGLARPRVAPITDQDPSVEEMAARVARFDALRPTAGYVDALIPGCERTTWAVLGRGPDAALEAEDFFMNLVRCEPGKSAPLHSHLTQEVFIVLSGEWEVFWGPQGARSLRLGRWDTISVPAGVSRGFRNAGAEPAMLIGIAGGRDPGAIDWPDAVRALAQAAGVELPPTPRR